jgi:hypothetical protein
MNDAHCNVRRKKITIVTKTYVLHANESTRIKTISYHCRDVWPFFGCTKTLRGRFTQCNTRLFQPRFEGEATHGLTVHHIDALHLSLITPVLGGWCGDPFSIHSAERGLNGEVCHHAHKQWEDLEAAGCHGEVCRLPSAHHAGRIGRPSVVRSA